MADKVIKHYYDEPTDTRFNLEPDKTKSISELSFPSFVVCWSASEVSGKSKM